MQSQDSVREAIAKSAASSSERSEKLLDKYLAMESRAHRPGEARNPPATPVVAGVDESSGGFLAAEQAAREARLRGWPLRIVHVQDVVRDTTRLDVVRTAGRDLLNDAVVRVHAVEPDVDVTTQLRVGVAAGELVSAADDAGLLVVGSRGRGGFSELLTGSVATHVATHARTVVLIVREPARPVGLEWVEHPIVVGIDGSDGSAAAFAFAVEEARLHDTAVLAVYASGDDSLVSPDPLRSGPLAGDQAPDVEVRRRRLSKDPRQALVGLSAEAAAVVVGARGRGAFTRWARGSVTQALIRHSHCPLFIVPVADDTLGADSRGQPARSLR